MNIPVVYEDEWLVVLDKPSGLLVIPTPKKESRTLTSILDEERKQKGLPYALHPCHRLDRETSGLIVYAKGKSVQRKMLGLFKQRKVSKTYLAFIQGALAKKYGRITTPIEGRPAITEYRLKQERKDFSILEVKPVTGRTNQIRIHLKAIGHPIVGERKFAFRKDYPLKAHRLCLHASGIEFLHPVTAKQTVLSLGLPQDLRDFLDKH